MRHIKKYQLWENSPAGVTVDQSLWLAKVCVGSWKMNVQGVIDVAGSVDLKGDAEITPEGENFHGLRFGKVDGYFDAGESGLTHLGGTPREVNANFYLKGDSIKTLEGGPRRVGGSYVVTECGLQSLEGCPALTDTLDLDLNELQNLKGAEGSRIRRIKASFNELESLEGMPRDLEEFDAKANRVSAPTLELIASLMKQNPDLEYGAILASLEGRVSPLDWKHLDKSSLEGFSMKARKGYKLLGGLGGI